MLCIRVVLHWLPFCNSLCTIVCVVVAQTVVYAYCLKAAVLVAGTWPFCDGFNIYTRFFLPLRLVLLLFIIARLFADGVALPK